VTSRFLPQDVTDAMAQFMKLTIKVMVMTAWG
jgi:hypothetical protein